MVDYSVKVLVALEDANVQSRLNTIGSSLVKLEHSGQNAKRGMDSVSQSLTKVGTTSNNMGRSITTGTSNATRGFQSVTTSSTNMGRSITTSSTQATRSVQSISSATNQMGSTVSRNATTAGQSVQKLTGIFSGAGTSALTTSTNTGKLTGSLANVGTSASKTQAPVIGYSNALQGVDTNSQKSGVSIKQLGGAFGSMVGSTTAVTGAAWGLYNAYDGLEGVELAAAKSSQAVTNAQIAVDKASKKLTDTTAKYGAGSVEATLASQDLEKAQAKLALATEKNEIVQGDLTEAYAEFYTNVIPQVITLGGSLVGLFSNISSHAGTLKGGITGMGSAFMKLKGVGGGIAGAFAGIGTMFSATKTSMSGVTTAAPKMSLGLRGVGMSVKGLIASFGPIGLIITGITVAFEAFTTNAFGFRDAINSIGKALGDIFPFMKPLLGLLGQWGDSISGAGDDTKAFADTTKTSMGEATDAVEGTEQSITGSTGNMGSSMKTGEMAIVGFSEAVMSSMASIAESVRGAILGPQGFEAGLKAIEAALARDPINPQLLATRDSLRSLEAGASEAFGKVKASVSDWSKNNKVAFAEATKASKGFTIGIEQLPLDTQEAFNGVINELKNLQLSEETVSSIFRAGMAGNGDSIRVFSADGQKNWKLLTDRLSDINSPMDALTLYNALMGKTSEIVADTAADTTKSVEEINTAWDEFLQSGAKVRLSNLEMAKGFLESTGQMDKYMMVAGLTDDQLQQFIDTTVKTAGATSKARQANMDVIASHGRYLDAVNMTDQAVQGIADSYRKEDAILAIVNDRKEASAKKAIEQAAAERILKTEYHLTSTELAKIGKENLPAYLEKLDGAKQKAKENANQLNQLNQSIQEARDKNIAFLQSVDATTKGQHEFGNITTISTSVLQALAEAHMDTATEAEKQHAADIKLLASHGIMNDLFTHNAEAARAEAQQLKFNDDVTAGLTARKDDLVKKSVDQKVAEQVLTKEYGYSSAAIKQLNQKDLPEMLRLKDMQKNSGNEVIAKLREEAAVLGLDVTKAFQMSEAGLKNWIMTHQKVEDAVTGSITYWNEQVDALKKQETEMKNARQWNLYYADTLGVDIPNASKMSYEQIQRVKDILESQVGKAQSVRASLEDLAVGYGMSVPNAVKASVTELNNFIMNSEAVIGAQKRMADNAAAEAKRMADNWIKSIDDLQSSMSGNIGTVSKARTDDIMKGGGKGDKQSDITFASNTFWDKFPQMMATADGSADKAIKNIMANLGALTHSGRVSGKEMREAMATLIQVLNDPKLSNDEKVAKIIQNMDKMRQSTQYTIDGFHYFGEAVKANFDTLGITITNSLKQGKDPLAAFTAELEHIRKTSGMTTSQFRDNFAGVTNILHDTSINAGEKMKRIVAVLGTLDPATKEMIMAVEGNWSEFPALTEYYLGDTLQLTLKDMQTFKDKWGVSMEDVARITHTKFDVAKKAFVDSNGVVQDLNTQVMKTKDGLATAVTDMGTSAARLPGGVKGPTDETGGAFTTLKDTVYNNGTLLGKAMDIIIQGFTAFKNASLIQINAVGLGFVHIREAADVEKPKIQAAAMAIGQTFGSIIIAANPSLNMIGQAFLNIGIWATTLRDNLPAVMTAIGKSFGNIIIEANKSILPIGQIFLNIATWASASRDGLPAIMTGIGKSFGNIWTEASKHINNIGQIFIGIATWATQLRDNLPAIMSQIGGTFQILVNTSAQMVTGVNSHFATIAALVGTLRTGIPEAMSDIGNSFQILVSASGTMVTGVNSHLQVIAALVGTLRTEMPEAMSDIGNSFESFVIAGLRYKPAVNGLFLNIGNGAAALMNNMPAAMTQIGRTFGNVATEGNKHMQAINNLFIMIATGAGTLRTGMPTTMRNIGGSFIFVAAEATKHKQAIQNQFNYIGSAAAALMNNMPAAMGAIGRTFSNVVTEGNKYKTGISNLFLMIAGGAATLRDGLPAVMNKIGSYFGIIVNASAPMVRGIRDHLGFVKSDITNILLMSMINASTVVGQQSRAMSTSFGTMASVIARTALVAQGRVNALRLAINALQSKTVTISTVHRTVNTVVKAAKGFEGVVNTPTTFQVAEGGKPEHVAVTPLTGRGKTNTRSVSRIDSRTAPLLQPRNSNLEKGGTIVLESPIYLDGRKISESTRKYNLATLGAKT